MSGSNTKQQDNEYEEQDNEYEEQENEYQGDLVEEDEDSVILKVLEQRARYFGIPVTTTNDNNLLNMISGNEEQLVMNDPNGAPHRGLAEESVEEANKKDPTRLLLENHGSEKSETVDAIGGVSNVSERALLHSQMADSLMQQGTKYEKQLTESYHPKEDGAHVSSLKEEMEKEANKDNLRLPKDSDEPSKVKNVEGTNSNSAVSGRALHSQIVDELGQPGAYAVAPPTSINSVDLSAGGGGAVPAVPPSAFQSDPLDAVLVSNETIAESGESNNIMEQGANTVLPLVDHQAVAVVKEDNVEEEMQLTPQVAVEEVRIQNEVSSTHQMPAFYLGLILLLLVAVVVILILGLTGVFRKDNDVISIQGYNNNDQDNDSPTLKRIKERGFLLCFDQQPYDVFVTGLENSLCQAVAAAILGVPAKVEYVEFVRQNVTLDLVHEKVDLIASITTHTMDRQVYERAFSKTGFSFSSPYLYAGIKAIGEPFYVGCIDNHFNHIGDCEGIRICLENNTRHLEEVARIVPRARIVAVDYLEARLSAGDFSVLNECNTIMINSLYASRKFLDLGGFPQPYAISNTTYSKSPLAIATCKDDPVFSDFVNSVLQALFVAEAHSITQSSASLFPQTSLFGDDYTDMFRHALQQVGNFAEIYNHTLVPFYSRPIRDQINYGITGLLYAHPFGSVDLDRDGTPLGTIMQGILDRGMLRCGVHVQRQGFATKRAEKITDEAGRYTGMDIDYCRALASSLFEGDIDRIEFIEVHNETEGYVKLANKGIDVLSGATWTLENDVRHEATQTGFSFSKPYFYGYLMEHDNFCLATRQDDHDWSSYVFWIVEATIFAEENGIFQNTSNKIPEVLIFGSQLQRCLKDAIWAVGNYAEIYSRNIQPYIPRGGRNTLNTNLEPGPMHYPLPGFL